jgi:sugar lactone lactonase YvrE
VVYLRIISLLFFASAMARWSQNGVTVAGGHGEGSLTNQLKWAEGLFVDEEDTVIVADFHNHRIVEWKRGDTSGTVLAGGNGNGSRPDQLYFTTDVIFDKETDGLIICDWGIVE